MLKVLLVDDEPIITKGLKKLISWEDEGFVIAGTADNVLDAIALLYYDKPEIVITDLCMPDTNGLELIKKIEESGLNTKVIVLSGFDEFEYAREAFTHGIVEYLLKPVTREKLLEVLKKVSDLINKEKLLSDKLALLKTQLNESMPLLKQKFLSDILTGKITNEDEILKKAEFLGINLSGEGYTVMAISIDNLDNNEIFTGETELLKFASGNIAAETTGNKFISYMAESGDTLFILLVMNDDSLPVKELFDLASEIKENLYVYLKASISVGISRLYNNIKFVAKAYNEANYALKTRYTLGQGNIIHINNIMKQKDITYEYPVEAEKKITESIIFENAVHINKLTSYLIKAFLEASGGEIEVLYSFCNEFLIQLRRCLRDFGENPDNILPYMDITKNLYYRCKTTDKLKVWLSDIISAAADYVSEKRKEREFDVIQEAKRYIDSNFAEELTLGRVASKVYMSPTYFSTLFKSKTGENFSDYLTRVRMEYAARKLSNSACRIYNLAATFGYKNPRYFSEAFKKYYGMTPKEYKDQFDR